MKPWVSGQKGLWQGGGSAVAPDWAGPLSEVVTDPLFAVSASPEAQNPKLLIRQTLLFGSQDSANP